MKGCNILLVLLLILFGCSTGRSSKGNEAVQGEEVVSGMVLIPAGSFQMGARSEDAYENEFPRHQVSVSSFYMDKYEVTNKQFMEFVQATGYKTVAERDLDWEELKKQVPAGTPKPADSLLKAGSLIFQKTETEVDLRDYSQWWRWTLGANWRHPEGPGSSIDNRMDHPAVHIAWEDARAYASWAGKRLPTEAEWEWAGSGGDTQAQYPWGDKPIEEASDMANFWQGIFPVKDLMEDGFSGTAPVGTFPSNGFGLFDMAGNVWEWCEDRYDIMYYRSRSREGLALNPKGSEYYNDPQEPYAEKHVLRGGSFLCSDSYCSGYRVARRMSSTKDSGFNHTGFRCVKDLN